MSQVYEREDGIAFVCRASRELHTAKKPREVLDSLAEVSMLQGDRAVVTRDAKGDIHTAVAEHDGFSLGEIVRDYFINLNEENKSLIWCEEVNPLDGECLLVIIVEGVVEFDAIIPPATIDSTAEAILARDGRKFTVIVHGDVPIAGPDELVMDDPGKLSIRDELIESFTRIDSPVFPLLEANERYRYLALPEAFKAAKLNPFSGLHIAMAIIAVGAIAFAVMKYTRVEDVAQTVVVDNYSEYRSALSSSYPDQLYVLVLQHYRQLKSIPGIEIVDAQWESGTFSARARLESDAQVLVYKSALENSGWKVKLQTNELAISIPVDASRRPHADSIIDAGDLAAQFIDDALRGGVDSSIGVGTANGYYRTTPMTFSYKSTGGIRDKYFPLMLRDQPVVLTKVAIRSAGKEHDEIVAAVTLYGKDT